MIYKVEFLLRLYVIAIAWGSVALLHVSLLSQDISPGDSPGLILQQRGRKSNG